MLRKANTPATPAPAPVAEPAPAPGDDEPKTLKELRAAIAKEREEARREREEARKEREEGLRIKKENGIRDAIKANGVAPEAVDVLFDHISQRHGSKISMVGEKPILTDDLGES